MITGPAYPAEHDPDWPLHIGTAEDRGVIQFEVADAYRYDVDGATMLYFIRWWVQHHKKLGRNHHDGHYWIRISVADLSKRLRGFSTHQVGRLLRRLIDDGAIIVGSYNDNIYDRTCWYTVTPPDE